MKSGVFQDAVESSTKVFGRKDTVRVVFEGDQAHTDGGTVVLPALPPGAEIHVEQADIIRGFRDHEAMHVRCTDTSSKALTKLNELTKISGLGALVQYCEDTRIEHAGIKEYGGMRHTLTATNTAAAKELIEQLSMMGKPEEVVTGLPKPIQFRIAVSSRARSLIGVENNGLMDGIVDSICKADPKLDAMSKEWAQHMADLPTGYDKGKLNEAASKKGTWDSFALAERMHKAISDYEEEEQTPPPPPPPGDGEDDTPQDQPPGDQPGGQPGDGGQSGSGGKPQEEKEDSEEDGDTGGDQGDTPQDDDGDDTQGGGDQEGDDDDGDGDDQGDGDGDDDDDSGNDGDGDTQGDDGGNQGDQPGDDTQSGGGSGGQGGDDGTASDDSTQSQPHHGNHTPQLPPEQIADIEKMLEEMRNQALNNVVQDIASNETTDAMGRVVKKKMFRQYSNKFSQKLPMLDLSAITMGHKWPSSGAALAATQLGQQGIHTIDEMVGGKRAMIRRLLELELQARADRRWESGKTSGRLHSVRLISALNGQQNVYQRRESGKDMDTILYISIDGSESMKYGGRARESAALAYALSEALERTGCDIVVQMWSNLAVTKEMHPDSRYTLREFQQLCVALNADPQGRINHGSRYNSAPSGFVSSGLLTRGVVKAKNQRTTDPNVRLSFGAATKPVTSSTPTYQAIFDDLRDLATERHAKKIYLHITDGDPDDISVAGFKKEDIMEEAHALANSIGVHMIGVGIAGNHVGHLFSDAVEVSGPDAYEPVMKKLAKLVAKEAGHAVGFKRAA